MFWAPNFLWGAPEFLDLRYKVHPDCDHVAKFHGDWPRELGDLVAKEVKKTSRVKYKAFRNYCSGWPKHGWNQLQAAGAELPATTRVPGGG